MQRCGTCAGRVQRPSALSRLRVPAQSLSPAARSPFYGPGHLESSPPPVAQRGRLSHPGTADRVPSIRPSGHRPPRTAGASGTSPHSPGQTWRLAPVVDALQALRGVPCTVAVTTVAARGDLTRFDNPRQLMHSLGFTPCGIRDGRAAPPGRHHQDGPQPGPPCPGRRRLGLSLPRQRAPASAMTPGEGAQADPR